MPTNSIQYPSRYILLLTHTIQVEDVPRFVPNETGHDSEICPGTFAIYDDAASYGKNDHDANLLNLMAIEVKNSLMLNSSKCKIKKTSIMFYGCLFTSAGIKPDPAKSREFQICQHHTMSCCYNHFWACVTFLSHSYCPCPITQPHWGPFGRSRTHSVVMSPST